MFLHIYSRRKEWGVREVSTREHFPPAQITSVLPMKFLKTLTLPASHLRPVVYAWLRKGIWHLLILRTSVLRQGKVMLSIGIGMSALTYSQAPRFLSFFACSHKEFQKTNRETRNFYYNSKKREMCPIGGFNVK